MPGASPWPPAPWPGRPAPMRGATPGTHPRLRACCGAGRACHAQLLFRGHACQRTTQGSSQRNQHVQQGWHDGLEAMPSPSRQSHAPASYSRGPSPGLRMRPDDSVACRTWRAWRPSPARACPPSPRGCAQDILSAPTLKLHVCLAPSSLWQAARGGWCGAHPSPFVPVRAAHASGRASCGQLLILARAYLQSHPSTPPSSPLVLLKLHGMRGSHHGHPSP
mmetsp:Transcript_79083/g.199618  ORF Transcript_79083/g.199618 Transcript_79083/m.199618 type:complete len:221 (+) Transcript_79083:994-1656(+)